VDQPGHRRHSKGLSLVSGAHEVILDVAKSLRCLAAGSCVLIGTIVLQGCAPEGEGSIKIQDPNGIRAKMGGGGAVKTKKPLGSEASKVKEQEEKAPTKHFQRG